MVYKREKSIFCIWEKKALTRWSQMYGIREENGGTFLYNISTLKFLRNSRAVFTILCAFVPTCRGKSEIRGKLI